MDKVFYTKNNQVVIFTLVSTGVQITSGKRVTITDPTSAKALGWKLESLGFIRSEGSVGLNLALLSA